MKNLILTTLFLAPTMLFAQFGFKAGYNFANVSNAKSINASNRSGFHVGVLLAPQSRSKVGSRSEIIFSRQGYDYSTGTNSGDVGLDYIQAGQMMSVSMTRIFTVFLGAQSAYLISAQVDSTNGSEDDSKNLLDLFKRVDYGYAVGVEVGPVMGFLAGIRYNVSLNKLYKSMEEGQQPTFTAQDAKNNVVQLYVGLRLDSGGNKRKKKDN